jgi:hypothetical protein
MWLSGTLVADLLITFAMVAVVSMLRYGTSCFVSDSFYQLWGVKTTHSHFESTDRMIMRLILLSIEVGALTTIVAAAELAISKIYPQYFLYEVPYVAFSPLFLQCILM